jgi:hypothetical protein
MPPATETELKEIKNLVIDLREEMRVGFSQVDTRLSDLRGEDESEICPSGHQAGRDGRQD